LGPKNLEILEVPLHPARENASMSRKWLTRQGNPVTTKAIGGTAEAIMDA
jgi:hypothetical protein